MDKKIHNIKCPKCGEWIKVQAITDGTYVFMDTASVKQKYKNKR